MFPDAVGMFRERGVGEMADVVTNALFDSSRPVESSASFGSGKQRWLGEDVSGERPDELIASLVDLTAAIRDLVARSPVSSEELLTAEQLGDLFRMSPRTLRDLAASCHIPHHRIGKHYRFSRDDITEILQMTRQALRTRRSRPRAA
jgi:excisionase family DNA binding protein